MNLQIISRGPTATQAVASAIAGTLLPGDVLLLDGDLGAGKTTFTQGLARAMGVGEAVTSPTFSLVRSYPTAFGVELIHVDVYRLDTEADVIALGLPEMLDDGAVAVIEWGEKAVPALGTEHLDIRFALTDVDGERRIDITPSGSRWLARWEDLAAAVAGVPAARGVAAP
jgi:tRNA threonylcarbamoyladenosine biosynthesis protein TsaE